MSFQSIDHLLGTLEAQASWQSRRQFQQLLVCWSEIVGTAVAAQTRPIGIQRRVLQVAASSGAWSQTLTFERQRILEKLNSRLPLNLCDIRFSTANWQYHNQQLHPLLAESLILWRDHPCRLAPDSESPAKSGPSRSAGALSPSKTASAESPHSPNDRSLSAFSPRDPQAAFRLWARTVRSQSQHLPLCPICHSPTPPGELKRWQICSLCAAKTMR